MRQSQRAIKVTVYIEGGVDHSTYFPSWKHTVPMPIHLDYGEDDDEPRKRVQCSLPLTGQEHTLIESIYCYTKNTPNLISHPTRGVGPGPRVFDLFPVVNCAEHVRLLCSVDRAAAAGFTHRSGPAEGAPSVGIPKKARGPARNSGHGLVA